MSENIENQSVNTEAVSEQPTEQETNSSEEEKVSEETEDKNTEPEPDKNFEDKVKAVFDVLMKQKQQYENEQKAKQEYLNSNLANYNTEEYLQNPEFKALYGEAFEALGTNLDTEKFIGLLDKYVEARIQSHLRKSNAQKENEKMTDSFGFQAGSSKKTEKKLRMQDIPPEELESYIAKYV